MTDDLPAMTGRIKYEVSCDNLRIVERVKIPHAGSDVDVSDLQWCPGCGAYRRRAEFGAKASTCYRCGRKRLR